MLKRLRAFFRGLTLSPRLQTAIERHANAAAGLDAAVKEMLKQ